MILFTNAIKSEFLGLLETIQSGTLHVKTPEGDNLVFGQGEPVADLHIRDWAVVTAMAARGDIGLGETYIEGLWETSSIETLMHIAIRNMDHMHTFAYPSKFNALKFRIIDRVLRRNSLRGSSKNIRSHYDVGNEFYQQWLDPSMTYSSALYGSEDETLESAQKRKYDRVLSRLTEGENVLEVGCGWGGFADVAADQGRNVTGLTISPSQKGFADARLDGRADIQLQDYRKSTGKFDNIVSIEMIEAVGEKYWPTYFATLKARLAEGGRAVIQAITVQDSYFDIYRSGSDFIRQYTFPGGMLVSDAVIAKYAKDAGLKVENSFAFGQDYARTCRTWAERMTDSAPRLAHLGYDDKFLRNWQYYLQICAASFYVGQTDVVQVELAHV